MSYEVQAVSSVDGSVIIRLEVIRRQAMITIASKYYMYISIGLAVFYIWMFIHGWKRGILVSLVRFAGSLASIWAGWVASPVLAEFFSIWPKKYTPMQDTALASSVYGFVNELAWFLVIFLILQIIIGIIESLARKAQKTRGIHALSALFGGVFKLCSAAVWTIVFCAVLSLPVFANGTDVVNNTLLGTVKTKVMEVTDKYVEPYLSSDSFRKLSEDISDLPEKERNELRQWLQDNGYEEQLEAVESQLD